MRITYLANIRLPTEKAHGIQILKACEAFARAGEEVDLLVPRRESAIKEEPLSYYGIKHTFRIDRLFSFDTVSWGRFGFLLHTISFALSASFSIERGAVVYGRDELLLSIVGLLCNNPLFWESHDGRLNLCARYLRRRASGIVVVTRSAQTMYMKEGFQIQKLLATPNGIDLADFAQPETKEVARARLGLPQDKTIALYIGGLGGWKGVDTLLSAAKLLPSDVQVAIIGGEEKQVKDLRERFPHVLFLGPRPYSELSDNQAAADVLVVPNTGRDPVSVSFTSPLKLIAHMASGRPIVASDLPSIRELVGEDTAILVSPDSPQALAEGIIRAKETPAVASRAMAQVKAFDWKERAVRIVAFIQKQL